MKKRLLMSLLIGVMSLTTAIPAFASPKQMADGTIFDAEYYVINNPDVAAVLGTDELVLYNHYINHGKHEGRKPCEGVDAGIEVEIEALVQAEVPVQTQIPAQTEIVPQSPVANIYKIILKSGYSWVDTTVSSYDEACAVARALGYDLWKIHYDADYMWCYGIGNHGSDNTGAFDDDFDNIWSQFGRRSIGEHDCYIDSKDGRIYIPASNGGGWSITTWAQKSCMCKWK